MPILDHALGLHVIAELQKLVFEGFGQGCA